MVDYSVFMDNKIKAQQLGEELGKAFLEGLGDPTISNILNQLKELKVKPYGDLTALEVWTRSAYQLANYCGDPDVWKAIVKRLNRYDGTVLEAMCGHSTYFVNSSKRSVVALDYCETSLERYPYPERVRIQCDLNQVKGDTLLPFFAEGQFDAVSVCFGFKYPEHIGPLVQEFRRILKPGGVLSFVENPHHAYHQLCKRKFDEERIKAIMLNNGYISVGIEKIQVSSWNPERGEFYHVEAIK